PPDTDITVRAARERVAAPIVREAAVELLSRELGLIEHCPETVPRALDAVRLCNAAQRDRLRAANPCDDERAAYRQLRPIRRERWPLAAKKRRVTVSPVSTPSPERGLDPS